MNLDFWWRALILTGIGAFVVSCTPTGGPSNAPSKAPALASHAPASPDPIVESFRELDDKIGFLDASAGSSTTDPRDPRSKERQERRDQRREALIRILQRGRRRDLAMLAHRIREGKDDTLLADVLKILAGRLEKGSPPDFDDPSLDLILDRGARSPLDEIRRSTYEILGVGLTKHGIVRYRERLDRGLETERLKSMRKVIETYHRPGSAEGSTGKPEEVGGSPGGAEVSDGAAPRAASTGSSTP